MTVSAVIHKSLLSDMPDAELAAEIGSGDDAEFEGDEATHWAIRRQTMIRCRRRVSGRTG